MASTQQSQAALLLKSLDDAAKTNALTIITPAISTFIATTDKLNDKLVSNISGYKEVIDENNELINDVINFNVDGSRGKFANNLKAFAINGTWSVYGQQYIKKKVPFVTQEGPLQKIVWTRNKIQEMLDATYDASDSSVEFNDEMNDIVRRFEIAYVNDIVEFNTEYVGEIDFDSAWRAARMKIKNIREDPHRYHDIWVHFFTNKDQKSIPKLIANIQEALAFYKRNAAIKYKLKTSNAVTDEVMRESDRVRESSTGFLRREGELKLLKVAGEESGDVAQTAKFADADTLNVAQFEEMTAIKPIASTDVANVVAVKTDAEIENEIMACAGSDSDDSSSDDSSSDEEDEPAQSVVRRKARVVIDSSDDESDDEEEAASPTRNIKRKIDATALESAVDQVAQQALESLEKKQKTDDDSEIIVTVEETPVEAT